MTATARQGKPRDILPWLMLAGVLFLLLTALGLTTHNRLARTQDLMTQQLSQHGSLLLQYLESATRASIRQGLLRSFPLQTLAEELIDQQQVRALAILGPHGEVIAAAEAGAGDAQASPEKAVDPLAGLSEAMRQAVAAHQPITGIAGKELVVGRPFEPLRRFMRPGRPLPPWARSLIEEHREKESGQENQGQQCPPPPPPSDERRGMGFRMHTMMMFPGWLMGPAGPEGAEGLKPYALVRLSTATLEEARRQDLRQAVVLAAIIFVGAGLVSVAVLAAARHRGRELERLRAEVAESEHLAAVGRLAGSVAHEVRNPLSALRGLVQFLAKGQEPGSKQAEYALVAVEEVDRLERVVSGLLEYTRPRPPRLFPLDVGESLKSTLELMRDDPRAQGLDLRVKVQEDLPAATADPDQIRQVLVNLVVNSLEALNGRGSLILSARLGKGEVVVEVADDGPGLPEGTAEQVFDPFFSTRERGSGLGLAIARRIVLAHGGRIKAANRPEGGAVFTFTLPLDGAKS